MAKADLISALLRSYAETGGINHIDGTNLPAQDSVNQLAADLMHVLFPGFFEESALTKDNVQPWLEGMINRIEARLATETEKCLRFAGTARQYSKNAMPQEISTASQIGQLGCFKCPYQAKVIRILLPISNNGVSRKGLVMSRFSRFGAAGGAAATA